MNYDDLVKLSERATPNLFNASVARLAEILRVGVANSQPVPRDMTANYDDDAALIALSVNLIRSLCDPKVQEAMARAICDEEWNGTQPPFDRKPAGFGERYRGYARAAIQALISGGQP